MLTIPSRHYTSGRTKPVRLIVMHTTETDCAEGVAEKIARWFASPSAPHASTHYVVDPGEAVTCVDEDDTAWHAPPANPFAIGVEQTGRAAWTAERWAEKGPAAMLARVVELVADICRRRRVPARCVGVKGLLAGEAGITTHRMVSKAWGLSTHWDPGDGYPLEAVLERVRAATERG